jgi:arginase
VSVIGVPLDLGAGRRGVDMGPSAMRLAGLGPRIRELGIPVEDVGDVEVAIPETHQPGEARLRYLREIRRTCELLRDRVTGALARGRRPVVLGGDHSIAMGTIAGVTRHFHGHGEKVGVVWIDAHGDANTAETTPSGNIHGMPMAVALGLGAPELLSLGGQRPMIGGNHAAIIGLRDVDPAERANVRATGILPFTMRDIDEQGMRRVVHRAIERASNGTAGIHVSLDIDSLDPSEAPGVGTPAAGGLTYREAHLAMEMLADSGRVVSIEVVEVNPILDERNRTAHLAVELLASLLGKRIL